MKSSWPHTMIPQIKSPFSINNSCEAKIISALSWLMTWFWKNYKGPESTGRISWGITRIATKTNTSLRGKNAIVTVQNAIVTVQIAIASGQNAIVTVQNVIASVQNTIASVQNEIASVQNAIVTVQNAIAMVQNAIAMVQNAIAMVQNPIVTVQNVIASGQNLVVMVQNAIAVGTTQRSVKVFWMSIGKPEFPMGSLEIYLGFTISFTKKAIHPTFLEESQQENYTYALPGRLKKVT